MVLATELILQVDNKRQGGAGPITRELKRKSDFSKNQRFRISKIWSITPTLKSKSRCVPLIGWLVVNHAATAIASIKLNIPLQGRVFVLKNCLCMNLQHGNGGSGFIPIQEYGAEFHRSFKTKKAVRLLYTGKNHYDLLV